MKRCKETKQFNQARGFFLFSYSFLSFHFGVWEKKKEKSTKAKAFWNKKFLRRLNKTIYFIQKQKGSKRSLFHISKSHLFNIWICPSILVRCFNSFHFWNIILTSLSATMSDWFINTVKVFDNHSVRVKVAFSCSHCLTH